MRLLLDTHTLVWYYFGDIQLNATARLLIDDLANTKFVSPASYWELAIKVGLAKFALAESYEDFIQHAIFGNGFLVLSIEPRHRAILVSMPPHHKDPFDRLMVAQAMVEGISLVSANPALDQYSISRRW